MTKKHKKGNTSPFRNKWIIAEGSMESYPVETMQAIDLVESMRENKPFAHSRNTWTSDEIIWMDQHGFRLWKTQTDEICFIRTVCIIDKPSGYICDISIVLKKMSDHRILAWVNNSPLDVYRRNMEDFMFCGYTGGKNIPRTDLAVAYVKGAVYDLWDDAISNGTTGSTPSEAVSRLVFELLVNIRRAFEEMEDGVQRINMMEQDDEKHGQGARGVGGKGCNGATEKGSGGA